MTPDPYKAGSGSGDARSPQTWNRFAYVLGDPMNNNDPAGLQCVATSNGYGDDGTGGGCPQAGVAANGDITPDVINVYGDPGPFNFNPGMGYTAPGVPDFNSINQAVSNAIAGSTAMAAAANQAQCLSSFHDSILGAAVKFFSLVDLVTDWNHAWPEWTLLPAAKLLAVQTLKSLSSTVGASDCAHRCSPVVRE